MAGGEPTAASESKAAGEKDGNTAAPPKPPFKYAGLNAMKKANWLSLFVHSWCSPMIHYCYRGLLRPADVYALPDDITAREAVRRFEINWKRELEKNGKDKASLVWAIIRSYGRDIWINLIVVTLFIFFAIVTPVVFLEKLVTFVARGPSAPILTGLGLVLGLVVCETFRSMSIQYFWLQAARYSTGFRAIVFTAVYNKALSLRDLGSYSVGELVNISVQDSRRLSDAGQYTPFIYISAVTGIVTLIMSTILIGPSALIGNFIFFLTLPIQIYFGKRSGQLRRDAVKNTDLRVRIITEILTCIKLIKTYAWELPFGRRITEIRGRERQNLLKANFMQSITISLVPILPALASLSTFLVYAYTSGGLSPSKVFTVLALFNVLRFSLAVLPMGVKASAEARVGLERLRRFLVIDDDRDPVPPTLDADHAVELDNVYAVWPVVSSASKTLPVQVKKQKAAQRPADGSEPPPLPTKAAAETQPALTNVSLTVEKGELIGICGGVGSGKSSLLFTLLAQTRLQSGSVRVGGSVAYVAQQAWIQSMSLKDNILFGSPYDAAWYNKVVDVCCLLPDFKQLPNGEMTEIGEKGVNLSGGQKQRVSLARAIYANRDIYLLDDPLSAVDAHVGRRIFNRCIRGLLRGKTVLLVTHQLQYLPQCDRVCFMDHQALVVGPYKELQAASPNFADLLRHHHEEHDKDEGINDEESKEVEQEKALEVIAPPELAAPKLVPSSASASGGVKTEIADALSPLQRDILFKPVPLDRGRVALKTYLAYARASGGVLWFLFIAFLFFVAMAVASFQSYWLSYWIRQGGGSHGGPSGKLSDNPEETTYAVVFAMLVVALIVLQVVRGYLFTSSTLRASTALHEQLFARVTNGTMAYFHTTPVGRIINRFSKDIDECDSLLVNCLEQLLQNGALILITIVFIMAILPWFCIPMIPITISFFVFIRYFRPTQLQTKRLDNISQAPLFSHLGSTLSGLTTIYAFDKKRDFQEVFYDLLELNQKCFFAFFYTSRWFGFRLDIVSTLIMLSTALIVVLQSNINPTTAALALMFSLSLGGQFQYTTRLSSEVEGRFTSAERIINYLDEIPQEDGSPDRTEVPEDWPSGGKVDFMNVEAAYREGLPPVTKNLSFSIGSEEKIGVAGRTGAGKSTLAACLYRLLEQRHGQILIDGVDIQQVNLHRLRSALCAVPQDPTLFVGTIRYNLDPFDTFTDEEIYRALEQTHMKEAIKALPKGLQAEVVENGENFSVGERQLLCLARAILRASKILILDESSASIDTKTDMALQTTIRQAFKHCTVLTIAHRLNTILDSDRIMILDQGQIKEFDTPARLIANPESELSKMLVSTGVKVAVRKTEAGQLTVQVEGNARDIIIDGGERPELRDTADVRNTDGSLALRQLNMSVSFAPTAGAVASAAGQRAVGVSRQNPYNMSVSFSPPAYRAEAGARDSIVSLRPVPENDDDERDFEEDYAEQQQHEGGAAGGLGVVGVDLEALAALGIEIVVGENSGGEPHAVKIMTSVV